MDLSSTSQVSTLVREPARVGGTAAPVPAASETGSDSGGQAGGSSVVAPQAVRAAQPVEEAHLPVPGSPDPADGQAERFDIEV